MSDASRESNHDVMEKPFPIQQQLEDFERENPKIAEAIRLFGMSLATYQGALFAMQGVRITQGDSTTVSKRIVALRG